VLANLPQNDTFRNSFYCGAAHHNIIVRVLVVAYGDLWFDRIMAIFDANTTPNATIVPVQLGMCLGGLVTTWSTHDPRPRLWSVRDSGLPDLMYEGKISKVARSSELPNRYREAAMLDTSNNTLYVTVEGEESPRRFRLDEPKDISPKQTWFDLGHAISRAIRYTAAHKNGILLLELGGITAPPEPYALFTTQGSAAFSTEGVKAIVETRPLPLGSGAWAKHLQPGAPAAALQAPMSERMIKDIGVMMVDAARTWGVSPWDLALTFGTLY